MVLNGQHQSGRSASQRGHIIVIYISLLNKNKKKKKREPRKKVTVLYSVATVAVPSYCPIFLKKTENDVTIANLILLSTQLKTYTLLIQVHIYIYIVYKLTKKDENKMIFV